MLALRTDELVVDFVDVDAVRCADYEKTVLKLDQILTEVEKDEHYIYKHLSEEEKREGGMNHK